MDNLAEKLSEPSVAPVDLKIVAEQLTAGEQLSKAREKRGMSRAGVARRLNMVESAIRKIDEDDFTALPGQTFVRGYLRNYAQSVGLNAADVLVAYQRHLDANAEPPRLRKRERIKAATTDPVMRLLGALSVLVFLFSSIYFWRGQQTVELMPATEQVTVVEVDTVEGKTHIEAVDLSAGPAVVAVATAEARLLVEFIDSSWLEVRNANDEVLFNGVKLAGEELRLSSAAFFDVAIGNAAAVKLSYNSAPVDLSNATLSGETTNIQLGLRQP